MRCAIAALMTFLVVASFNPDSRVLNPSPKLGSICASGIALVVVSSLLQFDVVEWWFFSSNTRFILFITAHPIRSCFHCLLLVLIYLYTMCCRRLVMHLQFVYCCCNLKCKKSWCCEHSCTDTPSVFWEELERGTQCSLIHPMSTTKYRFCCCPLYLHGCMYMM